MTDKEIIQAEQQKIQCSYETIYCILDEHLGEDEGQFHWVSYWDCEKSPVELCVYNPSLDRAKDSCIFCGKPNERK